MIFECRIWICSIETSDTSIPPIVEFTIRKVKVFEKCPHICITPRKNRINSHERRPTRGARIKMLHMFGMRISSSGTHNKSAHAITLANKLFNAVLDTQLHLRADKV